METRRVPIGKVISDGSWDVRPGLKKSIVKTSGLLYPVIVKKFEDDTFRLRAGRHRHACVLALSREEPDNALWQKIDIRIAPDEMNDAEIALADNCHCDNPLSDSRAIQDALMAGMDEKSICAVAGITLAQFRKKRQLVNLNQDFREMVECGDMSYNAAYKLCTFKSEVQKSIWAKAREMTPATRKRIPAKAVDLAARIERGKWKKPLPQPDDAVFASRAASRPDPVLVAGLVKAIAMLPENAGVSLQLIGCAEVLERLV